jgi:hypothetical protein
MPCVSTPLRSAAIKQSATTVAFSTVTSFATRTDSINFRATWAATKIFVSVDDVVVCVGVAVTGSMVAMNWYLGMYLEAERMVCDGKWIR